LQRPSVVATFDTRILVSHAFVMSHALHRDQGPSRMFGTTVGGDAPYAGAFLDGLQQRGVAGALKHWPELGAASGDPDVLLPTISQMQTQLQAIDVAPFAELVY
jgi:beta-glucosidase-like glycosyl hydrolase